MDRESNELDRSPWEERYRVGDTPWDLGGPHPELSTRLQDGRLAPPEGTGRALVPGAGRGHDALALARRGWTVTALDLVPGLAAEVAPALEKLGGRFLTGNALEFEAEDPFDLVWDHTFFCAIAPEERAVWGARARELVAPGGRYASLVFPVGKPTEEGGPPHGMTPDDVLEALGVTFVEVERAAVSRPVQRRTWREVWFAAERRALSIQD